jgi:hypothetical protein
MEALHLAQRSVWQLSEYSDDDNIERPKSSILHHLIAAL